PFVAVLVHRVEDAPVHRLEAVARIRQRPRHDHAHGVIEVAALHLLGDRDGPYIRGAAAARRRIVVVRQSEIPSACESFFLWPIWSAHANGIAPRICVFYFKISMAYSRLLEPGRGTR